METLISSHHYVWAPKAVSISSNFSTFSKSDLFKVWKRYDLIMAFYATSIYGQRMESTWIARGLPGDLALSVCKARSALLAAPVLSPYTCLNSPSHWLWTCLKVILSGRPSHASLLTLHSGPSGNTHTHICIYLINFNCINISGFFVNILQTYGGILWKKEGSLRYNTVDWQFHGILVFILIKGS